MRVLFFIVALGMAPALLVDTSPQPVFAQSPPESQPPASQPPATKAPTSEQKPENNTVPYPPFQQWIKNIWVWVLIAPVAVALLVWFIRISTSPSRDPSRTPR